ncbi:MAG: ABC transporter substrate-binding protein [Nitrospirales bacterium]|nr:ABC transporter substrate-binding protein [Nitrospirales bacterium]
MKGRIIVITGVMILFFVSAAIAAGKTVTFMDKRGKRITVTVPVKRAVFHINHELVPSLKLWDRVVGIGTVAATNDLVKAVKPDIEKIPLVGDVTQVNAELLLSLRPDLVITWTYNDEALRFLEEKGLKVAAFYPESLGELYEMIRLHGTLFEKEREAEKTIAAMEGIFSIIRSRTGAIPEKRQQKALWLGSKPTTVCGGKDPRIDAFTIINASNAASFLKERSADLPMERIIALNPDVIFITGHVPYDEKTILSNPQWRQIKAVKTGRVYKAPPWSAWSPRLAPLALWMARKTYPGSFTEKEADAIIDGFYRDLFGIPANRVSSLR